MGVLDPRALSRPLRFARNDLGIPTRSFRYSGMPNPLVGYNPRLLYRGGMFSSQHDFNVSGLGQDIGTRALGGGTQYA